MFKKIKKEYLILLIIIIVLSAYLLRKNDNKIEINIPELKQLKKDSIKKVVIENPKGNFTLKIDKKKWSIEPEGFPVLENKIEKMLSLASKTDISDLISRAGKYGRYGLGEKNRTIIKAFGKAGELRTITTGNRVESGNRTFVKLENDKIIYQARGDFKESFDVKKDDLINKKIYSFNSSDIIELIIEKEGKTEHFAKVELSEATGVEKKSSESADKIKAPAPETKLIWVNKLDNKKVNEAEIDSYIKKNSDLNCDLYLKKKGLEEKKGFLYIKFIDKTKKSYSLNFYKEISGKEKLIKVASSESDFVFKLSKENIDNLSVDPEKLKSLEKKTGK